MWSNNVKKNRMCVQTIFFDIRDYFEISVFEKKRVNYILNIKINTKICHSLID